MEKKSDVRKISRNNMPLFVSFKRHLTQIRLQALSQKTGIVSQDGFSFISGLRSQSEINFSQFDFDFDNFSVSSFQATKTQFKPEPIDLFKETRRLWKDCSQFVAHLHDRNNRLDKSFNVRAWLDVVMRCKIV